MQPKLLQSARFITRQALRPNSLLSRTSLRTATTSAAKPSLATTTATMTSGVFKYIDPASYANTKNHPSGINKPWGKVDGPAYSYKLKDHPFSVHDMRAEGLSNFSTDTSGFAVYTSPSQEKSFRDDTAVRNGYYAEVEALLRAKLPGIKKVVIFDHTIRRREKASPRQPVQLVHVDQTPQASEIRVRRHVPDPQEADELLAGRYQIINVWRPIENPASDFPLAVIDWRSTHPKDFIKVDLLYPKRSTTNGVTNGNTTNGTSNHNDDDNDDRGKEALPDPNSIDSTQGYEAKGETYAVAPNPTHKFYYAKNMTPDEAMFIKCFDSFSENRAGSTVEVGAGTKGLADCTPHTAFVDPATPVDAPGRQSIEVRCLVFYD